MLPHTHRPLPRAITRVCKTSIALVKKSIVHIFFRCKIVVEGLRLSIHTSRKAQPPSQWPVDVLCTVPIKEVLLVGVDSIFVVGMIGQVVLVRKEWAYAPQYENTFVSVHYRQFVLCHQLFATMSSGESKRGCCKMKLRINDKKCDFNPKNF